MRRAKARTRRRDEGEGQREDEVNAGRCLFKRRTQHHRMVGKKSGPEELNALCEVHAHGLGVQVRDFVPGWMKAPSL